MRLNALQLTNFRQHADTRIEFDLGLTGIIGPNGAGKTTILEAIAWALYGQPAARGTRPLLPPALSCPPAPVRVELDFDLAGHRYRIVRGLASAEVYLDGSTQPIAESITAVAELMQRRLGMTRAEFFHTYFTGQKELNIMAAMVPAERAQFLSRVLGYDRLRTAQSHVRERRRLIVAELNGIRQTMPDAATVARALEDAQNRVADSAAARARAETQRDRAAAVYASLAPRWEAAQTERDAQQQLLSDLRLAENDEASHARDLERLERESAAISAARDELEKLALELAPLNEVQEEFRRLEELAREEGRRQALSESVRALAEELTRLRERLAAIARAPQLEEDVTERLERKRREAEDTAGQLEARRTEWVRDRQEAKTKREELLRQHKDLRKQRDRLLELGEESECPICTRPLGDSFRTVLDVLEEQLETITVDGRYFNTRLEQLETMPEDVRLLDERSREINAEVGTLERQLAMAQSAVRELAQLSRESSAKEQRHASMRRELDAIPTGYDSTRHAHLRERMARLAPLNEQAARLGALIEREPEIGRERDRARKALSVTRARIGDLAARRAASPFSEDEYANLRRRYEEAAAAAQAADSALSAAIAGERGARDALAHAERDMQELARTREAEQRLESERRLHEELDRAYTDLRTDLNAQLRPELSELASAFLSELTDARYSELELDDDYDIVVLEGGAPKPVISGGEEDLANLVLRLAISQMIAERAGQSFSLLVLDEIFGSLDDQFRIKVVELLKSVQDRFDQIILITHIEDVREWMDRVFYAVRDEETGASLVRVDEPGLPDLPGLVESVPVERVSGADAA